MNKRHNLSKSETAAADISNRENLCCGTMFHFFFFLENLEYIGVFESAETQMEPVRCGV